MSLFTHRANPVLNLDIDTAMALGFGAESTDVDQSR